MIVGSVVSFIGVFLPWYSAGGESESGLGTFVGADFTVYESPGGAVIVFAFVTAGLGITLLAAKRVLAVAIIGIVLATFTLLMGVAMVGVAADSAELADGSVGFGAILQAIAPLATLAGAIVCTATKRRWPAQ